MPDASAPREARRVVVLARSLQRIGVLALAPVESRHAIAEVAATEMQTKRNNRGLISYNIFLF